MLIHHFGAETHAFRGLLTKMTEGKLKSPKKQFSERNISGGFPDIRIFLNAG